MISHIKILVSIDFSECSRRALAQVLAWSRRAPCEIHVAHVVDGTVEELASEQAGALAHGLFELERATDAELARLAAACDRVGPIQHYVHVGAPARAIVELAKRLDVDLIVMGTHGQTGLTHVLLGSIAENVVRHAHCPVVCVRPSHAAAPQLVPRILCAVDFSETSHRAMLTAAELARHLGVELILLHVRSPLEREDVEAKLASWRQQAAAIGTRVTTACVPGRAAPEIVAYARMHASDLIVMGTHGRTGLVRVLMGSVAEGVLRDAPCPVLTLNPAVNRPALAHDDAARLVRAEDAVADDTEEGS